MSRTVLILEPETSGLGLIPAAATLGYSPVIFDNRPLADMSPPARDAVATGSTAYHQVDTRSIPATVEAARQLAATTELVAVIPGFEYAVPVAAAVAAELNLPGIDSSGT